MRAVKRAINDKANVYEQAANDVVEVFPNSEPWKQMVFKRIIMLIPYLPPRPSPRSASNPAVSTVTGLFVIQLL
jgi:hypothetical protein